MIATIHKSGQRKGRSKPGINNLEIWSAMLTKVINAFKHARLFYDMRVGWQQLKEMRLRWLVHDQAGAGCEEKAECYKWPSSLKPVHFYYVIISFATVHSQRTVWKTLHVI